MKKLIFLVLFLNSFLYSDWLVNSGNTYLTCATEYPSGIKYSDGVIHYLGQYNGGTTLYYAQFHKGNNTSWGYRFCTVYNNTCVAPNYYDYSTYQSCVPITCDDGLVRDEDGQCVVPPPPPDSDGDGIPDKCDSDYVDYLIMDCDDDEFLNGVDDDIDGDGIKNVSDSNPYVAGTGDADINCKGVNIGTTGNLPFSFSTYTYYGDLDDSQCGFLLLNSSVYDAVVSLDDINHPYCEKSYCYTHKIKNDCDFDASWYRPGIDWDYIANKTETQCDLLVDGIRYSQSSFVVPDSLKCPSTSFCYLKRIDDTPPPEDKNSEDTDESMEAPDLNSTTADLAPLLQAQNTANKHLDDLKTKADISNNHLDDLKKTAGDSLTVSKDMKNTLNSLKSNSDLSLSNEASSLAKLASLDTNLKKMSDTSTSNQMIANGSLSSIDEKMTTNNTLLSDIKDSLAGDGTTLDTSANDGFSDLLTGDSDFTTFVTTQFSTFKDNINANFADINTQYTNAKSLFENPLSSPSFSGSYSASCFSFSAFGKNVTLDMSILGVIAPVIYFIFTLTFMILNFRFLLNHLLRGDN